MARLPAEPLEVLPHTRPPDPHPGPPSRPHRLQDALKANPSVLHRQPLDSLPPPAPELSRFYRRLSLRDVFLSYAGYRRPDDPVTGCRYGHGGIAGSSWTAMVGW